MSSAASTKQELVKSKQNAINNVTFSTFMNQGVIKKKVNEIIGGENGQRFIASIVSAVANNDQLRACTNDSIFAAALIGESLNLSPSPQLKQFFIVPYDDKDKGKVAQFQLGYIGYLQLAIRSGYYKKINVLEIKEGEIIKPFNQLTEEIEISLIEDDEEREKAETIGYYASYEYKNGFTKAIYWSKSKMENHAKKYSQAYRKDIREKTKYSFWSKNFDEMGKKTMIRQLISKWGILSASMQTAFESDMAVVGSDGSRDYVDSKEEPTIIEAKEVSIDEL